MFLSLNQSRTLIVISLSQNGLGSKKLLTSNRENSNQVNLNAQKRFESTNLAVKLSNFLSSMSDTPFCQMATNLMIYLHDLGSFSWPTTIFLTALIFRTAVCFPIKIYQEHLMARQILAIPVIQETTEKTFKDKNLNPHMLSTAQKKKLFEEVENICF